MTDASLPSDNNPLLNHLGIRLIRWEADHATFCLDIAPWHCNRSGSLQGGVIAAMLDVACGYAGLLGDGGITDNSATIALSTSYLARVSCGRVFSSARITRRGNSVYFASGELKDEDGRLIATAQGVFKRLPRAEDPATS